MTDNPKGKTSASNDFLCTLTLSERNRAVDFMMGGTAAAIERVKLMIQNQGYDRGWPPELSVCRIALEELTRKKDS